MIHLGKGFSTIDLSSLASGTLIIFVLLMAVKPQMVCIFLIEKLLNKNSPFVFLILVMCYQ